MGLHESRSLSFSKTLLETLSPFWHSYSSRSCSNLCTQKWLAILLFHPDVLMCCRFSEIQTPNSRLELTRNPCEDIPQSTENKEEEIEALILIGSSLLTCQWLQRLKNQHSKLDWLECMWMHWIFAARSQNFETLICRDVRLRWSKKRKR